MPDQRLTLILSLLRLHHATIPDSGILQTLVDEVRQAELREGGDTPGAAAEPSPRRVALCATTVQRLIMTGAPYSL